MYVQIYRYEIQKKDLAKWKKITAEANRIYSEYGDVRWERLIRKGDTVRICEIGYYASQKAMQAIAKRADADMRTLRLYHDLLAIVIDEDINEEMYESI